MLQNFHLAFFSRSAISAHRQHAIIMHHFFRLISAIFSSARAIIVYIELYQFYIWPAILSTMQYIIDPSIGGTCLCGEFSSLAMNLIATRRLQVAIHVCVYVEHNIHEIRIMRQIYLLKLKKNEIHLNVSQFIIFSLYYSVAHTSDDFSVQEVHYRGKNL